MAQLKEDKRLKKNYHVFILDKSGSMRSVKEETRTGFNEQIQELKENAEKYKDQDFYATFITFNGEPDLVFLNEKVTELYELKEEDYDPMGSTALFDAINLAIEKTREDLGNELREDNDTVDAMVSVVIMTDGWENSSLVTNVEKVPGLIKELRSTKKWTFAYIGANHDVEAMAKRMNIPTSNTIKYSSNAIGTKRAFAAARTASGHYYSKRADNMDLQEDFFKTVDGKDIKADESMDDENKGV